ncbi:YceI family protein [Pseudoalteromonas sp.]|uniref:YceI family protein n=1 Tax=Pseudoalteromonas sp. TaxID=53249 RepID=UPI001BCFD7BA|nr:YceI family protein [Pseudoalteromonas sp.]
MFKKLFVTGLSISCLMVSGFASANWQLLNDKSQLSFVSIKSNSIAEANHFTQLKGQLSEKGQFNVKVDLTSAETFIPIRNERLSKILFESDTFTHATLTTDLSKKLSLIKQPGQHLLKGINAELDFHGHKQPLTIDVLVSSAENGDLSVASFTPIIINSDDFKVTDGIMQLQKLAGLPSIATAVPVTFALTFKKQ